MQLGKVHKYDELMYIRKGDVGRLQPVKRNRLYYIITNLHTHYHLR